MEWLFLGQVKESGVTNQIADPELWGAAWCDLLHILRSVFIGST